MLTIVIGPLAREDLKDQYRYLLTMQSVQLADRFFQAAKAATVLLAEFPGHGSLVNSRNKVLRSIRCWPIKDFPNHIIYYQVQGTELHLLRVLHGARRVTAMLKASL